MNVIDRFTRLLLKVSTRSEPSVESPSIFCITETIPDLDLIYVIDLGAMAIDGRSEPYAPLGIKGLARIIGFDASVEECRKLSQRTSPANKYLPYILYDGFRRTLYITAEPSSSSFFEPNAPLLDFFHDLPPLLEVARTEEVTTTRLDDVPELKGVTCDFLKIFKGRNWVCCAMANALWAMR